MILMYPYYILKQWHLCYCILKLFNTFKGCQFNSRFAFSLEKVSDSVILDSLRELMGAFFPSRSPTDAIDSAIQWGMDMGGFLPSWRAINSSSSLKVGCESSQTLYVPPFSIRAGSRRAISCTINTLFRAFPPAMER